MFCARNLCLLGCAAVLHHPAADHVSVHIADHGAYVVDFLFQLANVVDGCAQMVCVEYAIDQLGRLVQLVYG